MRRVMCLLLSLAFVLSCLCANTAEAHNESRALQGRQLTQMKRYDKNGVLTYDCIYEYNALGQLTGTRHRYSAYEDYEKSNYTLTYDNDGRLVWAIHGEPIATYMPGYNSGARYTYNDKGQLVNEISWEGGAVEEDHEYDLSGKRTKTFYNLDFEQGEEKYIYSESGWLERVDVSVYSNSDKREVAYTYPRYITCDEQGRVIEERVEVDGMPEVITYDYSYLPFVAVHAELGSDYGSDHIELRTENDLPLIEVNLSNPTFYADDSGYLAKIVDKSSYSDAINTYEFYYDGQLALPTEGGQNSSGSNQGAGEHPYIQVVRRAIENECGYGQEACGTLYDIDGNGVDELLLTYATYVRNQYNDLIPSVVYSVYTVQNNQAVPLIEEEPLWVVAAGSGGRAAIVEKDGKQYIWQDTASCWIGPTMKTEGAVILYAVEGAGISVNSEVHYKEVISLSDNTVVETESFATINGTKFGYSAYLDWEESFTTVMVLDTHEIEEPFCSLEDLIAKLGEKTDDAWKVPELLPSTASFNTYFVENYRENIMQMLAYQSAASDIVADSSSFQINWNVYLSALADEDFIPLLDASTNSHYYYELALMESIARTKLNNEYLSSLTGQVTSLTLDAASLFVKYDANLNNRKEILEQSLIVAIPFLGNNSSVFFQIADYYERYCSFLGDYETIKAVYDLVAEMNGSLEDFLSALSNYAIISQTNQEILAGLKFLRNELEKSSIPEDKLILKAVNNLIIAFDQDMDRKLTQTVLKSTEEQLTNIFQAAMETAFGTTYEVADFVIDASATLSNVFYPTTISSASYCKIYADYAVETVVKKAVLSAYDSYHLKPDEQTASAIVGLYDLLERTYSHEIEVAKVLSEQLHKDGLVNGLRNLFFDGNLEEYRYEQECIQSYRASLNQIVQAKILAKQGFGLSTGELQPYSIVALCGKGVVYYISGTVKTGSTNNFTEGIVLSSNFFLDSYEISGYYLDEAMTIPFDQSQPVMAPLSLYCNVRVFHEINRDYTLADTHSNICVRGNSFADSMHLSAKEIRSGEMYEQVTEDFAGKKVELYDISLMDNGIAVQPDGDIVVEIPVTDDCENLKGRVYRVEEDGTYTDMNATYQNKSYSFKTSHFSYYVIVFGQPDAGGIHWPFIIIAIAVGCGLVGISMLIWNKKRKR